MLSMKDFYLSPKPFGWAKHQGNHQCAANDWDSIDGYDLSAGTTRQGKTHERAE